MRFIGDPMSAQPVPATIALTPVAVDKVTLPLALRVWSSWALDIPPTGTTGDKLADKLLGDAFRHLIERKTKEQRLRWLEANLTTIDPPFLRHRPTEIYRETIMEWWFALYSEGAGH